MDPSVTERDDRTAAAPGRDEGGGDRGVGAIGEGEEAARRVALLWQVRRVAEAVEALQQAWSEAASLHRSDLSAVTHLASAGRPLTMRELADRVALSPGATTAVVDRLTARGHAVRGRDPADGRRVTVHLSVEAEALGGRFFGELAGRVRAVLDGFDGEELAVLERFLAQLPTAIAPDLPPRSDP